MPRTDFSRNKRLISYLKGQEDRLGLSLFTYLNRRQISKMRSGLRVNTIVDLKRSIKDGVKKYSTGLHMYVNQVNPVELDVVKKSGKRVLNSLQKIKTGQAPNVFPVIKGLRKSDLTGFTLSDALKDLNQEFLEQEKFIKKNLKKYSKGFDKMLGKGMKAEINRNSTKLLNIKDLSKRKDYAFKLILLQARKKANFVARQAISQGYARGEQAGINASKIVMFKRWVSRFDSKVRPWHVPMNLQAKKKKELFKVPHPNGVDYMAYPKDPKGSPANVINCRCVLNYFKKRRKA